MSSPFTDVLPICAAAATLPADPESWADVGSWWKPTSPKTFSVEMWADAAAGVTVTRLAGAVPKPVVIADDDVDAVTEGSDTLTITGHGYKTGDGPVRIASDGVLPGGLFAGVDYWVGVVDANTVKLFASRATLLAGGSVAASTAIDITSAGTGTHTISDTSATERLHWLDVAFVGLAADGAVTLTAVRGWVGRYTHSRRNLAYALIGTVGSGNPSAAMYLEAE